MLRRSRFERPSVGCPIPELSSLTVELPLPLLSAAFQEPSISRGRPSNGFSISGSHLSGRAEQYCLSAPLEISPDGSLHNLCDSVEEDSA